jgi:hypothetical protein
VTSTIETTVPAQRGLVLDRYEPIRRLGSGGFGTVWLARDLKLSRLVALKRIPVPDATVAERARRESLAAARLQHPSIVSLYESAADDDAFYLVSEHVRGATLGDLQRDGALSDLDVLEIGIALCDALAHAHKRGVIHRDVKPQNVIIPDTAAADGSTMAKLTDFGIAQLSGDDALTMTGDVVGTLAYMAPEQAEGNETTPASDLYSLALCLYEAFSGVNPVRARGAAATARRVGRNLPSLGRLRRDLPRELCDAIDIAVAPQADTRGTVRDLRSALADAVPQVQDEPGTVAGAPLDAITPMADAPTLPIPMRALAAIGAGALAYCALSLLGPDAPAEPAWIAIAVTIAVALLPRAGWIATAAALCAWLAASGDAGVSLLLFFAVLPVPLVLARSPELWSAPGVAPLLGLGGVVGLFPALAGQSRTALQRAGLGVLGAWWVLMAEPMLGEHLVTGRALAREQSWQESVPHAIDHVLVPLVSSPAMGILAVWGVAALVLPWIVRGHNLYVDIVAATTWTATVAAATVTLCGPSSPSVVLGAILAGASAVALATFRGDRATV